jgi:hypothetical protein
VTPNMKRQINKTINDLVKIMEIKVAVLIITHINNTIFLPIISPILEQKTAPINYPKKSIEPRNPIIVFLSGLQIKSNLIIQF